jgi:uncharacterized membrane-anchored protein
MRLGDFKYHSHIPKDFNSTVEVAGVAHLVEWAEMTMEQQSNAKRSVRVHSLALIAVVIVIIITGWALVTVSSTLPPPSDFVALPSTPLAKSGLAVTFANISPVMVNGVANGISGYLLTASGTPVSGATVYITYYFQGAYRTERAATDQTGYFAEHFPMNWTGSLPLTLIYFGDTQHKGIQQVISLAGENLAMSMIFQ